MTKYIQVQHETNTICMLQYGVDVLPRKGDVLAIKTPQGEIKHLIVDDVWIHIDASNALPPSNLDTVIGARVWVKELGS